MARTHLQRNILKQIGNYQHLCINNPSWILKCVRKPMLLHHRYISSHLNFVDHTDNKLFDFHNDWPVNVKSVFQQDMILIEDFVSETEEERLVAEAEKSMKRARMRYQYDHWDNAIHGYREMEKIDWKTENKDILNKVQNKAFDSSVLPHVHILDLAADGIIKPHVDSSRYCGSTIAGLSLLTDCIMRLKRVDENQYKQNREGEDMKDPNRPKEQTQIEEKNEFNYFVDVLLKRRSLYIMKDSARYKFSHEVLPSRTKFQNNEICKDRRISIICRNNA